MKVQLILADDSTADIIRNMYPLYLHDLSEFNGVYPNQYGLFEDKEIKTLIDSYHLQDQWFNKPSLLFPLIIYADEFPAGFILIGSGKYVPATTDYYVYEFFVLSIFRGQGIAEAAAKLAFNQFKGKWELYTSNGENNVRALKFWEKTIKNYTQDHFFHEVGQTIFGEKMIFRFNNEESDEEKF